MIKKNPLSAVDSFDFGVLIYEVFNGDFAGGDQAGQTKNVPPTMHSSYKRLCNANPKARISVSAFLDQGNRTGSFFDSPLIKLTEGIDNLGVKTPAEREKFLEYVFARRHALMIQTDLLLVIWINLLMTFPRSFSNSKSCRSSPSQSSLVVGVPRHSQ